MNTPFLTGKIGLLDLPANKIFVALEESFKEELISIIRNSFKNIKEFTLALDKKTSFFHNFRNNQKIKLENLLKISDILVKKGYKQFNISNLEKNIKVIGTKRGNIYIIQPKLPFNFNNKYGAYLLSAIFFDGGIDREYKPHYGNVYLNMRKLILESVNKIFGKIQSKELNTNKGYFIRFPKSIGLILNHCFNIGIGNKIYCNNRIPSFIFKLKDKDKGKFIRQAFDDDGTISVPKKTIKILGTKSIKKEM